MIDRVPYAGEVLSLLTAFTWAWAVILFKKSGEKVHPLALGLFKNTLGMALFLLTTIMVGQLRAHASPWRDHLLLVASGALGIGVADTLFFACLNRLGASLAAIVSCLYSPFIIALSMAMLGESLDIFQMAGAGMIVSAIVIGTCRDDACTVRHGDTMRGVLLGVVSMACTAFGIVIIKPVLARTPILWATQVRLIGGEIVLASAILLRRDRRTVWSSLYREGGRRYTLSSSIVGGYLSMILWLAGMKFTQASIASALNETSTVFIFLLSAIFLREPITARRSAGIVLGFAGAVLVTFGG